MSISKSRLCNMKEAQLHTDVLMPLFRAMGYQDGSSLPRRNRRAGQGHRHVVEWVLASCTVGAWR